MLLFVDESGTDEKVAPCVVLGGVAIAESNLWKFEEAVRSLQREFFGLELSSIKIEMKGKRLLKKKTFRHAQQGPPIDPDRRRLLAQAFLTKGYEAVERSVDIPRTHDEYTAYGQAAIAFVDRLLSVAVLHDVKTFGSIVKRDCPQPSDPTKLRKDYTYLFERFFYYVETLPAGEQGLVICDELEVNQSQELIRQASNYFQKSTKGQLRSARIVPVPFFVKSDLTTAIQLADLVCYIANWAIRIKGMIEPIRDELHVLGEKVLDMQFHVTRADDEDVTGRTWMKYGFCYIDNLLGGRQKIEIESA